MSTYFDTNTGGGSALAEASAERALRDYFRHEMPNPWPACQANASTELLKPRQSVFELAKRYVALALSIMFLMIGLSMASSWLQGKPQTDPVNMNGGSNSAEKKGEDGKSKPPPPIPDKGR